jgi:hypothetical protein
MGKKDRHADKDIRKAIEDAEDAGWKTDKSTGAGHRWGTLSCGNGCAVAIAGTPRRPSDIAKRIREAVRKCDHNPSPGKTEQRRKNPR